MVRLGTFDTGPLLADMADIDRTGMITPFGGAEVAQALLDSTGQVLP